MNHLDELIHIQQEYEYFTKHCKDITTKEEYHLLKKKLYFNLLTLKIFLPFVIRDLQTVK